MAIRAEDVGIRITAEGVVETTNGIKLTGEQIHKIGEEARAAANDTRVFSHAHRDAASAAEMFVRALKDEAATLGMNRLQVKAYEADQLSLTAAQKASVTQSLLQIKAHEDGEAAFKRLEASAYSFGRTVRWVGAAVIGGGALSLRSVVNQADDLDKLSQRLGVTVEWLSGVQYNMKLANIQTRDFSDGMRNLARQIGEAESRSGNGERIFRAMGISVRNASGEVKSFERLLPEIAERFSQYADGPKKMALAMELFGTGHRDTTRLITLLNQGAEAFARNAAEARALGGIIGGDLARKAAEFKDNLTRVEASLDAVKIGIAQGVLPWLNKMLEQMAAGIRIAGGFGAALRLFGTMNPFQTPGEAIKSLNSDIAAKQQERARMIAQGRTGWLPNIDSDLEDLRKKKLFAQAMQRQEALAGYNAMGITRDETSRFGRPGKQQAPTPGKSDQAAINLAKRMRQEAAQFRAEAGRAADEIEDTPEVKRYYEAMQRVITGDYSQAPLAQRREYAQAVAARFEEEFKAAEKKRRKQQQEQITKGDVAEAEARVQLDNQATQSIAQNEQRAVQMRESYADQARAINTSLFKDTAVRAWAEFDLQKEVARRQLDQLALDTTARKALEEQYATWVVARHAQITEQLKPQWQRMVEGWENATQHMRESHDRFVTTAVNTGEQMAVEFGKTGRFAGRSFVEALSGEIARTLYQRTLGRQVATFANWMADAILGGGSSGGNVDAVLASGPVTGREFLHSGGIVGRDSSRTASLPDSLFAGARRYHRGGLIAPDEVPIIARRGEEVLTERDPRHRANGGGGMNLRLTMVNQSGTPLEATASAPRFDAEGAIVQVLIKDQRVGGPVTQGFQNLFNLRRGA